MRLEYIPVVLGAVILVVAAGIAYDAAAPENRRPFRERRRRQRAEIDTAGEVLVALGVGCLGVSLIGNEVWRWTTIFVLSGVVLVVLGAILNRRFLREVLLFRGASRRGDDGDIPRDDSLKLRIR
jgi:hypothetical protein